MFHIFACNFFWHALGIACIFFIALCWTTSPISTTCIAGQRKKIESRAATHSDEQASQFFPHLLATFWWLGLNFLRSCQGFSVVALSSSWDFNISHAKKQENLENFHPCTIAGEKVWLRNKDETRLTMQLSPKLPAKTMLSYKPKQLI